MKQSIKWFLRRGLPHVAILLLVSAYIVAGALALRYFDVVQFAEKPFCEVIFFTFIMITTIGWGNLYPTDFDSKLFCVIYSAVGIPLIFLLTADLGQFLAEVYWTLTRWMTGHQLVKLNDQRHAPLPVVFLLLLAHTVLGGLIFHFVFHEQIPFAQSVYFSFISFSTIGYGDYYVWGESYGRVILVIVYMTVGMAIMSTFIGALTGILNRVHYLGRPVRGSGEVEVWFGGERTTVAELLTKIADQFGVLPDELQSVLRDLNDIVEQACQQKESAPQLMDDTNRMSGEKESTDEAMGSGVNAENEEKSDLQVIEEDNEQESSSGYRQNSLEKDTSTSSPLFSRFKPFPFRQFSVDSIGSRKSSKRSHSSAQATLRRIPSENVFKALTVVYNTTRQSD